MLLAGGLAWFSTGGGTTYSSTAAVLLRPIPGNALSPEIGSSSQQSTVALETEAELVNSPSVLDMVNRDLGTDLAPPDHRIVATVATNTQILDITFTAPTSAEAREGARSAATSFLQYRADQSDAVQTRQLGRLDTQLETAKEQLRQASQKNQNNPTSGNATQVQLYAGRVAALQESIGSIEATDTDPGTLIAPASRPVKSKTPRTLITLGALLVGLGLGVMLALWRQRRDRHLHTHLGEEVLGLPVLGHFSSHPAPHHPHSDAPPSQLSEEFRYLRTALIPALHPTPTTLVVASLDAAGSSGSMTAELARYMSMAGFTVTLLDADLTRPATPVHECFDVPPTPGLAEVLLEPDESAITVHRAEGFHVVTSGAPSEAARERLAGTGFAKIVEQLSASTDLLIVSAPPVNRAESLAMATRASRLLLVVQEGIDDVDNLELALEQAHRLNVEIVGLVSISGAAQGPRGDSTMTGSDSAGPIVATVRDHSPKNEK
ncbi:hypothetical protein ASG90_13045 [Nocardioides sp. Soil797]|nr:hypothetical protein ASG90_13045 [Nocardioides sp. Soil797]